MNPRQPTVAPGPRLHPMVAVCGLLLVAFGVYALAWNDGPYSADDSQGYLAAAKDLSDWRFETLPFRPIGYPLQLRLLGVESGTESRIQLVQLALHLSCVLLLAFVLNQLGVSRRLLLLFAFIGVLPHNVQLAAFVVSEPLSKFFLVTGVVLAARWLLLRGHAFELAIASVMLGACSITRPIFQLLSVVLAIWLLGTARLVSDLRLRRRFRVAALVIPLGTVLIAGGVALNNHRRFGAGSSPLLSFALSARMANYIEYAEIDRPEVKDLLIGTRDELLVESRHHRAEGYIFYAFPRLVKYFDGDENKAAKELIRMNLSVLTREPRSYLREIGYSAARYWEPFSTHLRGMRSAPAAAAWILVHWLTSGLFWVGCVGVTLAGLGWWALGQDRRQVLGLALREPDLKILAFAALLVVTILYSMALSVTIGVGVPRYRAPTDLMIIASVILGIEAILGIRDGLDRHLARLRDRDCENPFGETL